MSFLFYLTMISAVGALHITPHISQETTPLQISRRSVFTSLSPTVVVAGVVSSSTFSYPAYASTKANQTVSKSINIQCLNDLQPLAEDCVRIFLCRHGETEYNRLGLVQGARVDVDLNEIGRLQAARLGQALALSAEHPPCFVHSPLKRASQTAVIAAAQYNIAAEYYGYKPAQASRQTLNNLKEIDFGSGFEGQEVGDTKISMESIYASWATGDLNKKMSEDGESLRDVVGRVSSALYELQRVASKNPGRGVVAVSHSSFLRMLIAVCQQTNVLDLRKTLKLANCCINVVDLPVIRFITLSPTSTQQTITSSSPFLGGPLSRAPSNYMVRVPKSNIIRLNEQQHLYGLQQECKMPFQN